jgi:hypothetical protein
MLSSCTVVLFRVGVSIPSRIRFVVRSIPSGRILAAQDNDLDQSQIVEDLLKQTRAAFC